MASLWTWEVTLEAQVAAVVTAEEPMAVQLAAAVPVAANSR